MSLSSLIVQREIASIREIEEALARQVLYGGDFVTNLLEVSSVEESTLMPLVAESFGLAAAPTGELPRAPLQATRLVAADVASERSIAPLEVGSTLVLAVAEPLSPDTAQELSFALALPIVQRIAPLFRIRQAIARDYGVPLDKRTARLITKVVSHEPGVSSTYPPPFDPSPIYRVPPRPPSLAPPPPPTKALDLRQTLNVAQGTLVRNTVVPPPRAARRRRGPLTADIAKAELDAAVDRDVVFDLLFEFARQFFDYTAVFVVQGEVAEGRDCFGDGAARDKVARIRVPFFPQNILAAAHASKAFVRQKPAADGLDRILMTDLGREGGSECVVFPIIVRKRVVALLFGDGGASGVDVEGVGQVNDLIAAAAGAFERVIMRRKLKGTEDSNAGAGPHGRKKSERQIPAVNAPAPPRHSDRPTSEEKPVETIIMESMRRPPVLPPIEPPPPTKHEPLATARAFDQIDPTTARSDRPPPPNLLAVRRPSGRPIPREEDPAAAAVPSVPAPKTKAERRPKSQQFKRAEAPRFDFGVPSTPSVVTEEIKAPPRQRSPLAQTLVSEMTPFEDTPVKPVDPSPARSAPITDLSPQPIFFPNSSVASAEVRPQAIVPAVTLSDPELTPQVPPVNLKATLMSGLPILEPKVDANPAPVQTLVIVTPEDEIQPIPIQNLGGHLGPEDETPRSPMVAPSDGPDSPAAGPEPVLALSTRKGVVIPPAAESRPMPVSEQQVSVPAHRPPSSRTQSSLGLPSVIVDVATEYSSLVERVLESGDEEAEAALTRAGSPAMPAIMAQFPGPIVIEAERIESGPLPRVAECGPVIRLIASQRRTALPFVLALVEAGDLETRFWATYLLTELIYPEAIEPALARVFDEDARVRRAARAAARALAETNSQTVVDSLAEVANARAFQRRLQAIEALAETREPSAVAALLPLLDEKIAEVVAATRTALVFITQQDFGLESDRWLAWWQDNRSRHRLEWLIDALMHDQRAIRGSASEELRSITKEYFGYYDDLPKRERERAQARYREWWDNIGRVRFSRASNRGV